LNSFIGFGFRLASKVKAHQIDKKDTGLTAFLHQLVLVLVYCRAGYGNSVVVISFIFSKYAIILMLCYMTGPSYEPQDDQPKQAPAWVQFLFLILIIIVGAVVFGR
jgi:hypothetical protein